ncbi:MAG: response regulator, partial [Clostridia bacterium]|nr:response regulator [Clostridia bacterium]
MGKILIVDDDISIAQLLSDALEDEGFETVVKNDSKEALEYIVSNGSNVSLITLDIMMPELSGMDLCRYIRSKVNCPIIFVSAKGKSTDAMAGLEAGA